ncbi:hypothetical protein AB0E52_09160 [Micrococcus luteus]|uniref:hypothetical protein n=1 Tax=Micrococcaceae TaxID=1268 RepID=UPI0033312198
MSTERARNLGAIFNAGKTRPDADLTAVPEFMPYPAPSTTRETMRDVPMETRQESTPESEGDTTKDGPREAAGETQEAELVVSNTAVYLPVPVLSRLKEARAKRKLTYTDLLIDAFDELEDEQILVALGAKPRTGGMPRRHRAPARGQGGVQVQLRLDQEQRAWLDDRVEQYGAPSRSALVAAVFDAWLPRGR